MDIQFYLVSSNFITLMQIGNTKGEVVGFFKKVIVILVKREAHRKSLPFCFIKSWATLVWILISGNGAIGIAWWITHWWNDVNYSIKNLCCPRQFEKHGPLDEMMSITSSKTYVVQDNLKNMAHSMKWCQLLHQKLMLSKTIWKTWPTFHSLDWKNNTTKKEVSFLWVIRAQGDCS
jgi:hypothetical protein